MSKLAIGLMTGTSIDAVDTVLVEIFGYGSNIKYRELAFITHKIPQNLKNRILNVCSLSTSNVREICTLNFELAELYVDSIKRILELVNLTCDDISFVGSHGQTIWHEPNSSEGFVASTLQIGSGQVIKEKTGITTVYNFRVSDVAQGGQGAPLVPYVDYLLYSSKKESIILQNIGGISNFSFLRKGGNLEDVISFDTGPGNMIIDGVCKRLRNVEYDENGYYASLGTVNQALLNKLMLHPYIYKNYPKSTGREEFGENFVNSLLVENIFMDINDLIATVTMFTAKSIVYHYEKFIFPIANVDFIVVTGGGSHNKTLLKNIKELLPQNVNLLTGREFGLNSDSKEACAFVILANETLNNQCSNVPNVTGAKRHVVLGEIALGRNSKFLLWRKHNEKIRNFYLSRKSHITREHSLFKYGP